MQIVMPRYLIIRISALGDVVHALPALSVLKKIKPEAKIDWLVGKNPAKILIGNPKINRLIVTGKNNIITYDLTRFAGRIGTRGITFISIIKITISISVFFALVMLVAR